MSGPDAPDSSVAIDRYWVPDPAEVWMPCTVEKQTDDITFFLTPTMKTLKYPAKKFQDLDHAEEAHLQGVDDICGLSFVNEGALLHTVRTRYCENLIYTRVARFMIAVNPFRALPIYSSQFLEKYKQASETMNLPPHIFAVGQEAMAGLRDKLEDRIILISGESGAGKTESAKLVLSFVSGAAKTTEDGGIESVVMQTNAIFEAFGNSMTVRNNNSSRFGKLLDIRFSSSMRMLGCILTNYLLETTRVCRQSAKERNYHVFYQLLKARWAADGTFAPWVQEHLTQIGLLKLNQYHYLQGLSDAPGINDIEEFHLLLDAFQPLGFSETLQCEIFTLLAGILTLGNCDFKMEGDKAVLIDSKENSFECVSKLLGMDSSALQTTLLVKKLVVGKDVTDVFLTDVQARSVRDTLARILYGRLFDWLRCMMNKALCANSEGRSASLGVLDIAGFESLEKNSLEQLLINLSNEQLQKSFNDTVFKSELEDYEREGVKLPSTIAFKDNAEILELIDGKGGIFSVLDDDMAMPKASDETFTAKILKNFAKHPRMVVPRFNKELLFGILHYAGEVKYSTEGFLSKNAEKMPDNVANLMADSSLGLLQTLGLELQQEEKAAKEAQGSGGKGKQKSASFMFRTSLRSLTTKIGNSERHYIRCIKPNAAKVSGQFESKAVMEQLLLSGILEAVHIRQQGFCTRLVFEQFFVRYRCIVDYKEGAVKKPTWSQDHKKNAGLLVERVRDLMAECAQEVAVGITKVLLSTLATNRLEHLRSESLYRVARVIQTYARRHLAIKHTKGKRALHVRIQQWLLSAKGTSDRAGVWSFPDGSALDVLGSDEAGQRALDWVGPLLEEAAGLQVDNGARSAAQQRAKRIQNELGVVADLDRLATSIDPMAIDKAMAQSRDLEMPERPSWVELRKRLRALELQIPLINWMQAVLELTQKPWEEGDPDLDTEVEECVAALEDAGLVARPEDFIPELHGRELLERLSGSSAALALIQELQTSIDIAAIEDALQKVKEWSLPETESVWNLSKRLETLRFQLPLATTLRGVFTSSDPASVPDILKNVVQQIRAAELDNNLEYWIPELGVVELVKDALAQHAALLELESVVCSVDLSRVGEALRQARMAGLHESIANSVEARFNRLKAQVPLVHRMERLLEHEGCCEDDLKTLVAELQAEGLSTRETGWLPELPGEKLMQQLLLWYDALNGLEALLGSIDIGAMEAALQKSKDVGLPQQGTPTKLAERLEWVKWQAPHIKAMSDVLSLQDDAVTDPDGQLRQVLKSMEDAGLALDPGGWLPEFEVEKVTASFSARTSALELLTASAASLEPAKIENALANASQVGLPKGSAARAAEAQLQALRIQLPLIEAMDAVITCDVSGDGNGDQDCDERLKEVAQRVIASGFRSSVEWLPGLPGPELCRDVMKRHEALLAVEALASSTDPEAIECTLLLAQGVGLPRGAAVLHLERRCEQLHMELPLLHEMRDALSQDGPHDGDKLKQVMERLATKQKHREDAWLPELSAEKMLWDVARRHDVLLELESLMTSTDVEATQNALEKAKSVGLGSCLATSKLEQRLPKLISQLERMKSMKAIQVHSKSNPQDYDDLVKVAAGELVKDGLDRYPKNWLPEIDGYAMAKDLMKKQAALEALGRACTSCDEKIISQSLEQGSAAEVPKEGASKLFTKVKARHAILGGISQLMTSVDPEVIKSALEQAKSMGLSESDAVLHLTQRLEALGEQLPLVESLQDVLGVTPDKTENCDIPLRAVYMHVSKNMPKWLLELPGPALFSDVESRHKALVNLEGLSHSIDVEAIQGALTHAEIVSLPSGYVLRAIQERLERLERQLPLVRNLEEVLKIEAKGDERIQQMNKLKKAVADAQGAGLQGAGDWIAELPGAKLVQDVVRKASLVKSEVRASRMIRAAAMKKGESRMQGAKGTIRQTQVNAQAALMDKLQLAADRYDARELATLLAEVVVSGNDLNGVLQYRLILQQLQSQGFIERAIREAEEEVRKTNPKPRDLWRLMNLSEQLQALGGDDKLMRSARLTVTVASRQTCLLAQGDVDAASIEGLFDDISSIHLLKDSTKMAWQQKCISHAQTEVPRSFEEEAVRNFRNILTWMTDRPASDTERQSAVESVVRLLRLTDELRDEIYIQVLKQLHHNPSLRSLALGWELLVSLCKSMLPSDRLFNYVKTFLDHSSRGTDKSVARQAERCLQHMSTLEQLPRMSGHLYKSRPKDKVTRGFDKRFVILRNMHLFWWRTQEEAELPESAAPNGGPLCKGFLSLAVTSCSVELDPNNDANFILRPNDSGWTKGRMHDSTRVFTFDTTESEHPRERWVEAVGKHIKQADLGKSTRLDNLVRVFFLNDPDNDKD